MYNKIDMMENRNKYKLIFFITGHKKSPCKLHLQRDKIISALIFLGLILLYWNNLASVARFYSYSIKPF
jgi:hypothetical protein